MRLAERTGLISPPGTSKMRMIANELRAAGVHVINFAAGELDVDTSDLVKEAAQKAVNGKRNVYTPTLGLRELRARIAERESVRCGVEYAWTEVGVTCGAKQALFNAMMVLVNPGDEVIIPRPCWVTFPTQAEIAGATPVFVDTRTNGYHLTASAIERALSPRTKAVILNTPHNPTGVVYSEDEIAKIAHLALAQGLWVVFDECYAELVRSNHQHHNIVRVHPPSKQRTILVNSFSKSYAITGWRIGYVCGPAEVIKGMENLQGHTTSNACSISQYAAYAALNDDNGKFTAGVNGLLEQRLALALEIVRQMDGIRCASAEGAFYLFLDISNKLGKRYNGCVVTDVDVLCELILNEANVAVVAGSAFGDPTGVRLSYAIASEDVVVGLERLARLFAAIQ